MSLIYKKGSSRMVKIQPHIRLGAYGATISPEFSVSRLSLLDRGFVFAIAHVRGGSYLGEPWYDDGRLLKKNTFLDFIACSKYLVSKGYTSSRHLYAHGGSAGAAHGCCHEHGARSLSRRDCQCSFRDLISTMMDSTIPLTTGEYREWGDPNKKKYYDYMLSYSPMTTCWIGLIRTYNAETDSMMGKSNTGNQQNGWPSSAR